MSAAVGGSSATAGEWAVAAGESAVAAGESSGSIGGFSGFMRLSYVSAAERRVYSRILHLRHEKYLCR